MVKVLRFFFWLIRNALIWAWRITRFAVTMFLFGMASLWVGVPEAARRLALYWFSRTLSYYISDELGKFIYHAFYAFGFIGVLVDWVFLAHFAVWVTRQMGIYLPT